MLACIGLFSYCGVNLTQTCPVKTWTCKEKYRMIFVFPQVPLQSVQNSSVSQRRFASNCCTGCFLKDHIHHLKKKTFNLARTSCLHVHWQFTIHTNFISVSMEIKVPNFVYFLALTCSTAHVVKRHDIDWVYVLDSNSTENNSFLEHKRSAELAFTLHTKIPIFTSLWLNISNSTGLENEHKNNYITSFLICKIS